MRSAELARLAGVTVRALRHYHQVGVLADPERGSNGYRSYDVHDLIRVVRIRRLASLGIPLERMPELLDGAAADGGDLLDELDAELAGQIERLTGQRKLIARVRAHDAPPDLPPELAPFFALFAAAGLSPDLVAMDRDQSVLLAHLVGEEGMPYLVRIYERIGADALAPARAEVTARFERLGAESHDDEVAAFVDSFLASFRPVLDELSHESEIYELGGGAARLFTEYTTDVLTERQRHALALLATRLEE